VLLAFGLLAAACGDDDNGGGTASDTSQEATTTTASRLQDSSGQTRLGPASEGTEGERPADWDPAGELTVAYTAVPAQLDPAGPATVTFLYPIYDRLTEMHADYSVHPRLAKDWEFPDANTMVLHLREGVTFHDGTPFDAEAVKVNIERYRDLPTSTQNRAWANVTDVEVVDPLTVRLTLARGGSELPVLMSQTAGMMVSPTVIANAPETIATQGAGGSGPYQVERYQSAERISYVPWEGHWNKSEGLLARLTIIGITAGQSRLTALQAGDADLALALSQQVPGAKQMLASGQLQGLSVVQTATQNGFFLRSTLPPFDNPKVREAVHAAIDQDGIANGVYGGACKATNQFFPEGHWAHSPEVEENDTPFDPERARALLAESGVTDLRIDVDFGEIYRPPAEAIQAQLEEVGFDVNLVVNPGTDFSFRDGRMPAQVTSLFGIFDPSDIITRFALGGPKLLEDPDGRLDQLAGEGGDPTGDAESWGAAYGEIWKRLYTEHIVIPTCSPEQVWAHRGKVANLEDARYLFAGTPDLTPLYVAK